MQLKSNFKQSLLLLFFSLVISHWSLVTSSPSLVLADPPPGNPVSLFGPIQAPPGVSTYGSLQNGGLINFFTVVLRTMIVLGSVYTLFNFILAGYQYLSAGNDAKALQAAWGRIWQSLVGLVILFGSFVFAAVFGYLLTKDPTFILKPQLYGPQ